MNRRELMRAKWIDNGEARSVSDNANHRKLMLGFGDDEAGFGDGEARFWQR